MSSINLSTPPAQTIAPGDLSKKFISIKPETPFGDMALALSGGGFRAAAFTLGAISYLNRAWYASETDILLKHVSFITSTSGGSLTNAVYSTSIFKPGFVFSDFYAAMKDFIDGEVVLSEVFEILSDPKKWDEVGKRNGEKVEKSHNLINAFAKAYDNVIFKGQTLGVFFNRDAAPHLQTVCFNSTELNNGIAFRFQTNGDPKSVFTIGNYYLHFKAEEGDAAANIARKLKISDIAATSSCFPAGFEPMIYPNDYIHPGLQDVQQMVDAVTYGNNNPLKDVTNEPFCMVDGGVVDNQGLESMMMEDNFRANHKKKQFDLMMVCDVGSYFMDRFKTPAKTNSFFKNLTISRLNIAMICGLVLAAAGAGMLFCHSTRTIGLILLTGTLIPAIIYSYIRVRIAEEKTELGKSSWGKVVLRYGGYFFGLKLGVLQQMISARLNSVIMLNLTVFLTQERRQSYNEFYTMPAYKHRVLSCLIYEFSAQHVPMRQDNLRISDGSWWPAASGDLSPGPEMETIATRATGMATTLWFTPGAQIMRDDIIACGQFTMCYNLLKHIYRLEVLDANWKTDITLQNLKARLKDDWKTFLRSPKIMVSTGIFPRG